MLKIHLPLVLVRQVVHLCRHLPLVLEHQGVLQLQLVHQVQVHLEHHKVLVDP